MNQAFQDAMEDESHTGKFFLKTVFLCLGFLAVYIWGCLAISVALGIDERLMFAAGAVFTLAFLLALAFQKFMDRYGYQERERLLIRQMIEGSRAARLVTDAADNPVFTNSRFLELCEHHGKPGLSALAALFSDADTYRTFQDLSDRARKGEAVSIELESLHHGGSRWYEVAANPLGWAGYVHWRVEDVTTQRQLERDIREEREKLVNFTDNAPVGFFSLDEKGEFLFANATLAGWLGVEQAADLNGKTLHSFLEIPPKTDAPYHLSEKGGARQVAEVNMKGENGRAFLASINQTVVHLPDGGVITRGIVHDLTSEREMRKALEASEDRFQKFFDEAPLGIALVGEDGKVQDCNAALAAMLGMDIAEVESKNFKDLIGAEDKTKAFEALAGTGQGERMPAPMEILLTGKNNVSVQMHARRIKGSGNIVLHFLNLTEQKRLEAQFVQSQKMQAIGQLAGGVAHDFNNLLTAIIGFCDLLLLRHKPGDPSFSDIMQIKQNSNRAANLVRQLLAFSRQQTLRPKVQDITDILIEVSHLIRRLIGVNIELELTHGSDLGLVRVDEGQMEQVLINLAVNARDAMEQGGKLTIQTLSYANKNAVKCGADEMPPGQWVAIQVIDTGTGIRPENMGRILEPFFTTKGIGQGTGLGLATVYGIIRQTGGYLGIESTVGKGTTFTIYLPRLSEAEAVRDVETKKVEEEQPKDLTGSARILLVEDEDAVRTFSTRALTNKGYQVLGAADGQAALELLKENDIKGIDLMITDVMMPGMDGPTVAAKIREKSPDMKIIFISGYTEDRLKDHMGKGIFFLAKPFTLKQLAEKVKEALEN
jgi:two-component system cell cycle sensor histidine kinase/response regulator CckA